MVDKDKDKDKPDQKPPPAKPDPKSANPDEKGEGSQNPDLVKYHLVLFSDSADDPPRCIICDTKKILLEQIEARILKAEEPGWAFAFGPKGRVQISTIKPISIVQLDDGERVTVGNQDPAYDETGRFEPLR